MADLTVYRPNIEDMDPKEKAAILIVSLGKDVASEILKHMSDDEIEQLTLSISSLKRVNSETSEAIINEFYELCKAQKYVSEGGLEYARSLLKQAIGEEAARDILKKLTTVMQIKPFDALRKADVAQVVNLIQGEHPQTIAVMLSYLSAEQAAALISNLPIELQSSVVENIASMGMISPEFIKEAELVIDKKLSTITLTEQTSVGGIDTIVAIINAVDRSTEQSILESIESKDAELADEIRRRMFVFEDIVKLDSRAIQRVLREVDNRDLAIALKGSAESVSMVIFQNISTRMQSILKEDMEFMGPVRIRDVEEAQQKIVNMIRTLESQGEIVVSRGGEDEMIV